MLKKLAREASLYSLSSFLSRGLSLITVPVFTRILTPADYGALDLLSYAVVLAPMVIGAALDQAVTRFYMDPAADPENRRRIASTALFYNVVAFGCFALALAPFAGNIAREWLDGQVGGSAVLAALALAWVQSLFYAANSQLRFMFRARAFALTNMGNALVSTGASFAAVVWLRMGVTGVLLGQVIGQLVFTTLSLWLARQSYGLLFDRALLGRMLRFSLPLVPGTVAFYASQYVDRYILNELRGLAEVGVYGMGARVAALVNLFLMGFQGAWWPRVMNSFREPGAPETFRRVFEGYLFVTLSLLMVLSLFGREILQFVTTDAFVAGYRVVPMLVTGAVLASISAYFTYGIPLANRNHYRMVLNLGAVGLNVLLNVVFVPQFGAPGAALANAASFAVLCITGMVISQHLYPVPYSWPRIFAASGLALFIAHSVLIWDYGSPGMLLPALLPILLLKAALAVAGLLALARALGVPLRVAAWRRLVGI